MRTLKKTLGLALALTLTVGAVGTSAYAATSEKSVSGYLVYGEKRDYINSLSKGLTDSQKSIKRGDIIIAD